MSEPAGIRTPDNLVRNQALCPLSYGPSVMANAVALLTVVRERREKAGGGDYGCSPVSSVKSSMG